MQVKEEVIKELQIIQNPSQENHRIVYRVVKWNNSRPLFEKRAQYKKDGEWMNGRAKGLTDDDIVWVEKNVDEILYAIIGGKYKKRKKGKND